ncbi:hypothetical protein GCM10025867_31060 [Frondihabitans sucicola]|uniref:Uncharacterized protein n=1 Tax=Frondihabitans sucicola TaxID=1268041 RepID=A0ABM8GR08_9MICO|nr:hypothetical protein [Frondihabitans sucicola]BDZ50865.1 hypothetical protein GCM10025867_31060 [Frondihabitans sucicola]
MLSGLSSADRNALIGKEFFPQLISGPFHHGLVVVFLAATIMTVVAAVASLIRGKKYVHLELPTGSVDIVEGGADTPAETVSEDGAAGAGASGAGASGADASVSAGRHR